MTRSYTTRSYEVRNSPGRGKGVFAVRHFHPLETVMIGVIDRRLTKNQPEACQIGEGRFALHAGVIRLVNHSCDPNCGISVNSSGAHDFVARRAIRPGEELCFDYAMRNERVEYFAEECSCGAEECRGEITGWSGLDGDTKARYRGFVAPFLLELDHQREHRRQASTVAG